MPGKKLLRLTAALLSAAMLWGCGGDSSFDVGGGSSAEPQRLGSRSCMICHSSVVTMDLWNGSAHDFHNSLTAGCEGCHGGGEFHRGLGPIPVPSPSLVHCSQCHDLATHAGDDPTTAAAIEGYVLDNPQGEGCLSCHSAKDPQVRNWNHNPAPTTIHQEWAKSAHGGFIKIVKADNPDAAVTSDIAPGWVRYNWDAANRADCQRCHTATGAMNYLNNPAVYEPANNNFSHLSGWTSSAGSPQNEMLYCWGCHSDVGSGELRNPGALNISLSNNAQLIFNDLAHSNVCVSCHSGRASGESIKNRAEDDFGDLSFINSHYLPAAGTVYNNIGYHYDGQSYAQGFHKNVGAENGFATGAAGSCVACHMSGPEPHTFQASVASTSCVNCHGGLTEQVLVAVKDEFRVALDELKIALEARGIYYYPAHPYFFNVRVTPENAGTTAVAANAFRNWNGVNVGAGLEPVTGKGKDVMGAAFNYNLLKHEPGAYVHNKQYALKLIADSIDFLADGAVDGLGIPDAVTEVINSTLFADMTSHGPATLVNPNATNCSVCHTAVPHYNGTNAQYYQFPNTTAFLNAEVSCGQCHAGGDFDVNRDILSEYAESRHGAAVNIPGQTAANTIWRGGNTTNAGCAVSCHDSGQLILFLSNGTAPTSNIVGTTTTGNTQRKTLSCNACHTSLLTGAVRTQANGSETVTITVPGSNPLLSATFANFGSSHVCVTCHSAGRGQWGASITSATVSIPAPHALPQGLTLTGKLGYQFPGQTYPVGAHQGIGGAGGPCVTCHMSGDAGHTLKAVDKNTIGTITAVNFDTTACLSCHSDMGVDRLNDGKEAFQDALDALIAALAEKGVTANAAFSTFTYRSNAGTNLNLTSAANWNTFISERYSTADPPVARQDLVGAMFNLRMFMNSRYDRAAYVHNWEHALTLIAHSIDLVGDGAINGTPNVAYDLLSR